MATIWSQKPSEFGTFCLEFRLKGPFRIQSIKSLDFELTHALGAQYLDRYCDKQK